MDSKSLEEYISCGICFESFNENNRCPRILICGHTFCHTCLEKILIQSPCCPTCKAEIQIKNANLISVNYIAKAMVSKVRSHSPVESQISQFQVTSLNSSCEKLASEGLCSKHNNNKELRCMDCEAWICGICSALNHKQCRTLLVRDAYKEMKEKVTLKIDSELVTRKSINDELADSLVIMEEERKKLIDCIKRAETKLKECETRISELKVTKSEDQRLCDNLRKLQKSIENCSKDNDFSKALRELDYLMYHGKQLISKIDTLKVPVLWSMESLRYFGLNGSVYAVHDEDEPLYGLLKVKDGQIWISCFQKERPKANVIPFSELISRFGGFSELPKKIFLQLTPEDRPEEEIDVVIETDGESPRGKNFILLCSGLKGHNYKGRPVKYYVDSSYQLHLGPPPVVEGIKTNDAKTPWKEGFVLGMQKGNSCFDIALRDNTSISHPKIGVVVSGLQKLKEFKGHLITKETGLVI